MRCFRVVTLTLKQDPDEARTAQSRFKRIALMAVLVIVGVAGVVVAFLLVECNRVGDLAGAAADKTGAILKAVPTDKR